MNVPIPAMAWLRNYDRTWLTGDITAGLTAAAVIVPQAMAYAVIAGLPVVAGLYTALIPLIVYALMGTSRVLSVTTTSTIAILTAGALRDAAPNGNSTALISVAASLACLVGIVLVLASVLRLGVVANFISEPVLVGFKSGIGLVIAVDQMPKILGVHFAKGSFFQNVSALVQHIPEVQVPTLALGLALLIVQLGFQRWLPSVPAGLITIAAGIAASAVLGLERLGVELVGAVQGGLPSFARPEWALVSELWAPALGIGLMSFVETIAAARAFQGADEPRLEPNRELLALALTNLVGGMYQAMPSGGGTSQTAVNRKSGASTQVASLTTAVLVVGVLGFLSPVVALLPQAALAAVVMVAAGGMIKPQEFRLIWQVRGMEFSWAIAAVVGVVVLGTLRGILVAVILSLLAIVYHANHRPVFVIGRKPGTDFFRPRSDQHPEDETFPGLLLLKTEGIIHFGNAQRVGESMLRLVAEHAPRVIVLDFSAIPDLEYTALHMLTAAERKLRQQGITLCLAGLNPEALQLVQRTELGRSLGRQRMYFNLEQAVTLYQKQTTDDHLSALWCCDL